jgi:hypothetical protein
MAEPIPVKVTRYACPSCGRTATRPSRTREHMSRCWWDPANRSCKTCVNFERWASEYGDSCAKGVDLSGHPGCARCAEYGFIPGVEDKCSACNDVPEVRDLLKPGPIIHCDLWQEGPAER